MTPTEPEADPPAKRTTADDRLRRLLALIPWVASQDGPTVKDVCARFGCTERQLVADIELVFLCGVHPWTPDALIEAVVEDGRVWIRYADWFRRPLRLTPPEALALVARGAALLAVPGTDPAGPLARGLAKLASVLGVAPGEAMDVELGPAEAGVLDVVRHGAARHHQVELDYYSFGRDGWSVRIVDPWRVFSEGGSWYVEGWCHQAGDTRLFRVDRVRSASALESTFTPPPAPTGARTFSPRADDPVVVLDLAPAAGWVATQYPNEGVQAGSDGRMTVRLRVSERAWLERLLLRLGPDVVVVEGPADLAGAGSAAAARLRRRYG